MDWDNKNDVLRMIKQDSFNLQYASDRLKDDRDVVLEACLQDGEVFQFASERLRNDIDLAFKIFCENGYPFLNNVPDALKDNENFMFKVIDKDTNNFDYLSKRLQNDKKFCLKLCKDISGYILSYLNDDFRDDYDIVLAACNEFGKYLKHASDRLKNNKDILLAACSNYGHAYQWASAELKKDKDIAMCACIENHLIFRYYLSEDFKNDIDFIKNVASKNPNIVLEIDNKFRDNFDIFMTACKRDGLSLKYASANLKDNKEIVLVACENNGEIFEWISDRLINDYDVILAACRNKDIFEFIDNNILNDENFNIRYLNEVDSNYLFDLNSKDKLTDDFLNKCIINSNPIKFISELNLNLVLKDKINYSLAKKISDLSLDYLENTTFSLDYRIEILKEMSFEDIYSFFKERYKNDDYDIQSLNINKNLEK